MGEVPETRWPYHLKTHATHADQSALAGTYHTLPNIPIYTILYPYARRFADTRICASNVLPTEISQRGIGIPGSRGNSKSQLGVYRVVSSGQLGAGSRETILSRGLTYGEVYR